MYKTALGLVLASFFNVAQASSLSIANQSSVFGISGYDGQPASVTGTKRYGVTGKLTADTLGTVSFTYLGQESGYLDSLKFNIGPGVLTESDLLGQAISKIISAGAVGFSFMDNSAGGHVFDNTTQTPGDFGYAFLMDNNYTFAHNATIASGPNHGSYTFDYILGFNDSYIRGLNTSGDADYDDFVVGVNFKPSPVPLPAALPLMLSGLGLMGLSSRRRKNTEI